MPCVPDHQLLGDNFPYDLIACSLYMNLCVFSLVLQAFGSQFVSELSVFIFYIKREICPRGRAKD